MPNSVNETQTVNTLLAPYLSKITQDSAQLAFASKALEAYIWGYSFAWFYAKEQEQTYAIGNTAQDHRSVDTPLNSFYVQSKVTPVSTGNVAPDVAVIYANAWIHVTPGKPVVVQVPNTAASANQFTMMQISNSATENLSSFNSALSTHAGGAILFYSAQDNPDNYTGNFIYKEAVNTTDTLLTGRTLVDASATASGPYALSSAASLAQQYVAATYDNYVQNHNSMAGLSNTYTTAGTSQEQAAQTALYNLYSTGLDNVKFWTILGQALSASPLPSSGPGSAVNPFGQTPTQYADGFSSGAVNIGLSATGFSFANLTPTQIAILNTVASVGSQMLTDLTNSASTLASSAWNNVPADLGNYANNILGYLERDIAHVANTPSDAVYPTLYKDSAGNALSGKNTYVMEIPKAAAALLPPLAKGLVANQDGFWALTAYDSNLNVTPAVTTSNSNATVDYAKAVNSAYGYTPKGLYYGTSIGQASGGYAVNEAVGSLNIPGAAGVPASNALKTEANGNVLIIFSPEKPADPTYANNWIATPLLTFNNDTGVYSTNTTFSAMLRVYNPNLIYDASQAKLLDPTTGQSWAIPQLTLASGAANMTSLNLQANGTGQVNYIDSALADQWTGVGAINIDSYSGPQANYTITIVNNVVSVLNKTTGVSDTLSNFTSLAFSDGNVAVDLSGNGGALWRVYESVLQRAPDAAGFGYWLTQLNQGQSLSAVTNALLNSAESGHLNPNISSLATPGLVSSLYQNLLHRPADIGGLSYWLTAINQNPQLTSAQVIDAFANSPEYQALTVNLIAHGISYTAPI